VVQDDEEHGGGTEEDGEGVEHAVGYHDGWCVIKAGGDGEGGKGGGWKKRGALFEGGLLVVRWFRLECVAVAQLVILMVRVCFPISGGQLELCLVCSVWVRYSSQPAAADGLLGRMTRGMESA
jgi:hypothetical protein